MTVKEVVMEYAKEHGFDGLVGDGCGCSIKDDFAPCGNGGESCELGYLCPCSTCDEETRSNCRAYDSEAWDYMVLQEKCEMRIAQEERERHARAQD